MLNSSFDQQSPVKESQYNKNYSKLSHSPKSRSKFFNTIEAQGHSQREFSQLTNTRLTSEIEMFTLRQDILKEKENEKRNHLQNLLKKSKKKHDMSRKLRNE